MASGVKHRRGRVLGIEHYDATFAIYHALGQDAYAPARRATSRKLPNIDEQSGYIESLVSMKTI